MFRSLAFGLTVALLAAPAICAEKLNVGDSAPTFTATDATSGKEISLETFKDAKAVVVCFTCNRCPVAIMYEDRFVDFANTYGKKGVKFVAIDCNGDTQKSMAQRAEEKGFPFPYAADDSGDSGRAYTARVTPHLYLLDGDRKVAYIGAFDDNTDASKVDEAYLANAVDAVLAGKAPKTTETRAVGCGIRLKRPKN